VGSFSFLTKSIGVQFYFESRKMTSLRTVQEVLDLIAKGIDARDANAVRLALADFTAAVANGEIGASNVAIVYRAGGDAYKAIRAANRQKQERSKAPRPADNPQVLAADHFTTTNAPDWATELLAAGNKRGSRARNGGK
jgi:hypothetical protein